MTTVPTPEHTTPKAIYEVYRTRAAAQQPRSYLGWSEIGHECERYLWLKFRWAEVDEFDGRMARLFDSGHREEDRVLSDLKQAGMSVWDRAPDGKQFGIASIGGHLRGHLDAVVLGLPEAPKTPHLVDIKTINTKRFKEVTKKAMKNVYPKYWAQAHGYMKHNDLTRAIFIFVCKDDDQIHVERFEYDASVADHYEARARRLIEATEAPPRIDGDAEDEPCRYCPFKSQCFGTTAPLVNCRTCTHSTPVIGDDDSGSWRCEKFDKRLTLTLQRTGCTSHRYIPILLEKIAKPADASDDFVSYQMPDGRRFLNGEPPIGFASTEIRAAQDKGMLVDDEVLRLRAEFTGARVVA